MYCVFLPSPEMQGKSRFYCMYFTFQVMSKFAHENIAQYYTAFVVKLELWVVMRLYGGGSVLDVMKHIIKTVCISRVGSSAFD
jgi:serine/threonine protein kinase